MAGGMLDPNATQGQYDPSAASPMPDQSSAPTEQGSGLSANQIDAAKRQAEQQVDSTIGQFASKIPGGDQLAQQAEQQANSAIENLLSKASSRLGTWLRMRASRRSGVVWRHSR